MLSTLVALAAQSDASAYVRLEKIGSGVFAAVRQEPPGLAVDCNVLFIVNEKDVVMVDANVGPESAKATLTALAKVTTKPISTIIATHYHDDHMGGISTVKERFPKAKLIAHKSSPRAIQDLLKPARQGMIEIAPQMCGFLQSLMDKGKSFGGWDITDEERKSYKNDIRIAERYAKEMPAIPLPKPDGLVGDKIVIRSGSRRIEVLHLGEGHTPSDLVVWLPRERICAVGDLVVWPVPLVGGPQSDVLAWPRTLARVRALGASAIVPGHGPVMRDYRFLRQMESLFSEVTTKVKGEIAAGRDLKNAKVELGVQESKFCGSSKVRKVLFDQYVKGPSIASAYRLLAGAKLPLGG